MPVACHARSLFGSTQMCQGKETWGMVGILGGRDKRRGEAAWEAEREGWTDDDKPLSWLPWLPAGSCCCCCCNARSASTWSGDMLDSQLEVKLGVCCGACLRESLHLCTVLQVSCAQSAHIFKHTSRFSVSSVSLYSLCAHLACLRTVFAHTVYLAHSHSRAQNI